MEINKRVSDYLIALLKSTIHDTIPLEKPDDVSWQDLFNLATYHQVEEMVFYAVNKLESRPSGEVAGNMNKQHEKNQLTDMLQRGEAEQIIQAVTKEGISILPLKGAVLKKLYPKEIFRQMADLDYLVLPDDIEKIVPIMEGLGYDASDIGLEASHDVYIKLPYMEVEVHRRLLPPTEENHWHTDDIWDRLIRDEKNNKLLHMSIEDFYLFHLLHFEKHYSMGGSGIKGIVDQYYLMKNYRDKLDWDYVNPLLKKMNYVEFEKMCDNLSEAWFGEKEMSPDLEDAEEYIINSGAFGTFEQYQKWSFERYKREQGIKSKKGYFFRRAFMERERMEYIYPSLKKHRWLLPFFWIHRLVKTLIFARGRMKQELDYFKKD